MHINVGARVLLTAERQLQKDIQKLFRVGFGIETWQDRLMLPGGIFGPINSVMGM